MEKIISVKEGKIVEKDGKEWIELIDQEDKKHRIFPSILGGDEVWVHLDKEIAILKPKIEDGSIGGLTLKLTKEKKGMYWNVIGVEEVKDIFEKEAMAKVTDSRQTSIERQVSLKGAIDLAVADKIKVNEILTYADLFNDWLTMGLKVEGPPEPEIPPETKGETQPPLEPITNTEDLKTQLKDLYKQKKITGKELVGWGISKWADIDTLTPAKLGEIAKILEKL